MSEGDGNVPLEARGALDEAVARRLAQFDESGVGRRIWDRDPTVWAEADTPEITNRLGWLTLPDAMAEDIERLDVLAEEAGQFDTVALIGMGGSSLAPEVFQSVFGNSPGQPALVVLDSTHPRAVLDAEDSFDIDSTLFLVASKSGSTVETMSLYSYFWDKTAEAGDQFIALTDPGSSLQYLAEERAFRHVFSTTPDVGGRYSALTFFGLVPAAVIGVDIGRLLAPAAAMAEACGADVPAREHPGLSFGAWLGEAARVGRDKMTIVTPDWLAAFPEWIEQLVAESTGKNDVGILPVANEPPAQYGNDRVFVGYGDVDLQPILPDHPRLHLAMDPYDLAAEMYRAEFAVAVAGAVLGIQPFDQPNVEAAKVLAREAMAAPTNLTSDGVLRVVDAEAGARQVGQLVDEADVGDYVAIQAYLPPGATLNAAMQSLRAKVGARGFASTAGVGPRYLHSTGQLHKGGPNTGIFVQVVDSDRPDVAVPETDYTFGDLIDAQARGDAQALVDRGRRLVRLGTDDVEVIAELLA